MSVLKRLIGAMAERVSARVGRHDLFEKEGERASSPPLGRSECSEGERRVQVVGLEDVAAALSPEGGLRVVHHWATWCSGCIEELPQLHRVYLSLKEHARFHVLSWDRFQPGGTLEETLDAVTGLMRQHQLDWTTLVLNDQVRPEAFFAQLDLSCQTVPQTWVMNDSGQIIERVETALDAASADALIAYVKSL